MSGAVLHSIGPDDWERWRTIRMRSLQRAPDAFGSTYERELAFGEADWRARLDSGFSVVATRDGADVAMGAGFEDEPGELMVVAMFTDEAARGLGIGRSVLDHVVGLARQRGLRAHLWVVEGNPAQRVYEAAGFVTDGQRDELRPGVGLDMVHLRLPDGPGAIAAAT